MTTARDLDHELALDRLEPVFAARLGEHARAHWARACDGDDGAPPWPELGGEAAWRSAARAWREADDPLLRRRGAVLARWIGLAIVECEPAVQAAAGTLATTRATISALSALATARNRAAARLGFSDLIGLSLAFDEVSDEDLERWIATPATTSALAAGETVGADAEPLALLAGFRAALGLGETVTVALAPPGRGLARTFVIAPPDDVRVVWSPGDPGASRRLAHELGHALYATAWRGLAPGLAAPSSRLVDEGVAEWSAATLMGDAVARHARWLPWQRARAAAERALYRGGGEAAAAAYRDTARAQLGIARELVADVAVLPQLAGDPGAQLAYLGSAAVADAITAAVGTDPRAAWLVERLAAGAAIDGARWWSPPGA